MLSSGISFPIYCSQCNSTFLSLSGVLNVKKPQTNELSPLRYTFAQNVFLEDWKQKNQHLSTWNYKIHLLSSLPPIHVHKGLSSQRPRLLSFNLWNLSHSLVLFCFVSIRRKSKRFLNTSDNKQINYTYLDERFRYHALFFCFFCIAILNRKSMFIWKLCIVSNERIDLP